MTAPGTGCSSKDGRVILRLSTTDDADLLYSDLVGKSGVTKTLLWDGPESLESYRKGLEEFGKQTLEGKLYSFIVVDRPSGKPGGCIDLRPETGDTGSIGMWIAERAQGRGLGSAAVEAITRFGIEQVGLAVIEAHIFVGNGSSRMIFEKNGYGLVETRTGAVIKGGRPVDVWVLKFRAEGPGNKG